jgi:uncharacterized protein YdbL (DUF1318 family)
MVVLLSVLLIASIAFAELGEKEKHVYYDYLETTYFSGKKPNVVYAEVSNRNGITVEELKNILQKAMSQEPTEQDWQVYDEIDQRLWELNYPASVEVRKKIYQEVAAKYGISLTELLSIDYRCAMSDMVGK